MTQNEINDINEHFANMQENNSSFRPLLIKLTKYFISFILVLLFLARRATTEFLKIVKVTTLAIGLHHRPEDDQI
jgi:hypothetical protein